MSAVLIISFLLLTVTAFAIYRWLRKPFNEVTRYRLAPPRPRSLFADQSSVSADQHFTQIETSINDLKKNAALLARAAEGDKEALSAAHASGDPGLYREVLDALVAGAINSHESLRSLTSSIVQS